MKQFTKLLTKLILIAMVIAMIPMTASASSGMSYEDAKEMIDEQYLWVTDLKTFYNVCESKIMVAEFLCDNEVIDCLSKLTDLTGFPYGITCTKWGVEYETGYRDLDGASTRTWDAKPYRSSYLVLHNGGQPDLLLAGYHENEIANFNHGINAENKSNRIGLLYQSFVGTIPANSAKGITEETHPSQIAITDIITSDTAVESLTKDGIVYYPVHNVDMQYKYWDRCQGDPDRDYYKHYGKYTEYCDMNRGVGGDEIYLYYTTDQKAGNPINGLFFSYPDNQNIPSGYECVKDVDGNEVNFNSGNSGNCIKLAFRRSEYSKSQWKKAYETTKGIVCHYEDSIEYIECTEETRAYSILPDVNDEWLENTEENQKILGSTGVYWDKEFTKPINVLTDKLSPGTHVYYKYGHKLYYDATGENRLGTGEDIPDSEIYVLGTEPYDGEFCCIPIDLGDEVTTIDGTPICLFYDKECTDMVEGWQLVDGDANLYTSYGFPDASTLCWYNSEEEATEAGYEVLTEIPYEADVNGKGPGSLYLCAKYTTSTGSAVKNLIAVPFYNVANATDSYEWNGCTYYPVLLNGTTGQQVCNDYVKGKGDELYPYLYYTTNNICGNAISKFFVTTEATDSTVQFVKDDDSLVPMSLHTGYLSYTRLMQSTHKKWGDDVGTVTTEGNATLFIILGAVLIVAAGAAVVIARKRKASQQ